MPLNFAPLIKYGPVIFGAARKLVGIVNDKAREEEIQKFERVLESIEQGVDDTEKKIMEMNTTMSIVKNIAFVAFFISLINFLILFLILYKLS